MIGFLEVRWQVQKLFSELKKLSLSIGKAKVHNKTRNVWKVFLKTLQQNAAYKKILVITPGDERQRRCAFIYQTNTRIFVSRSQAKRSYKKIGSERNRRIPRRAAHASSPSGRSRLRQLCGL